MRRVLALCALALVAAPGLSDAHIMPDGQGSTRLVANKAYTLISVPVAVLTGFDDDRNGAISVAEAATHRESLQKQIEQRVKLVDANGVAGRTIYSDLQVPHYDSSSAVQSGAVIHIRVSEWDAPPRTLELRADVFTWKDRELYFRTIMGDSTEAFTLTASRTRHLFFDPTPKTTPGDLIFPGVVLAALLTAALAVWRFRQPAYSRAA
jgi:hypothetical protein